jgi:hypothetical protein
MPSPMSARGSVAGITTPTDKHCRSRPCRPVTDHEDRYDELIEKLIRDGPLSYAVYSQIEIGKQRLVTVRFTPKSGHSSGI